MASYSSSIVTSISVESSIPELIPQHCHGVMSVLGARDDTVNMIYCAPDIKSCHTLRVLGNIDQKLPKVQIKQTLAITGGPWGPGWSWESMMGLTRAEGGRFQVLLTHL